jgi:hypothetical protein
MMAEESCPLEPVGTTTVEAVAAAVGMRMTMTMTTKMALETKGFPDCPLLQPVFRLLQPCPIYTRKDGTRWCKEMFFQNG